MSIQEEVKQAILKIEPYAEIYLFGSRARGDNKPDSDWDFLIILNGNTDFLRKKPILDTLLDIELKRNTLINTIIRSNDKWYKNSIYKITPFHENLTRERILL